MNCTNCTAPVKIIPAGVSKKTNKPYNSFWKCDACGNTGNIGQPVQTAQPQRVAPPQAITQGWTQDDRAQVFALLGKILKAVEELKQVPF
jgi:hypothetical protein